MHEFIPYDESYTALDIVATLRHFQGSRELQAVEIPDWMLVVVADEPITPEKVQKWWNDEDLEPARVPPKTRPL